MPHSPPLILVVDDEPAIRQFLTDLLDDLGYSSIVARHGREGLARARQDQPDLIISDRNMPDMDGLAMLWALRDDASVRHTPFIFASGGYDRFLVDEARRQGAVACLAKPFQLDELRSAIQDALALDHAVSAG